MTDSTNPRVMADNIRELSNTQAAQGATFEAEIEALQIYDDAETDTGQKWIDGSPIYRKVFEIEHLPNNTQIAFNHDIANLGVIITLRGAAQIASGATAKPIPFSNTLLVAASSTQIIVTGGADYSSQSGVIIIEYTKAPAGLLAPNPDDMRTLEETEEPINEELKKEEK